MRASLPLLLLLIANPLSAAVSLTVNSQGDSAPGDTATVCVTLATGGADVAGTQNDLAWDGSCLTLPGTGSCYAAGTHSKSLQGRLLDNRDFAFRALILSLSDVDPIDDGVLYCCDFIVEASSNACCAVDITGTGASDSRGNALAVDAIGGQVCSGSVPSFTPTLAATPAASPTPPGQPTSAPETSSPTPTQTPLPCSQCSPSPDTDNDGCQVAAPASGGMAVWPLVAAAALLLCRRRSV
jgi:hypothetical protein